jgi:hypothetical protein
MKEGDVGYVLVVNATDDGRMSVWRNAHPWQDKGFGDFRCLVTIKDGKLVADPSPSFEFNHVGRFTYWLEQIMFITRSAGRIRWCK